MKESYDQVDHKPAPQRAVHTEDEYTQEQPYRPDAGHLVTGLYHSQDDAERAFQGLTTTHGYRPEDVSVLMSDETRKRYWNADITSDRPIEEGSRALEGLGLGGAVGGSVGAVIGAVAAIGTSLVFPGIGLVVAGPIAGLIAGGAAGGAAGGLFGALIGAGIPDERAEAYEQGLRDGGIVLGTHARDEEHAAALARDMESYGGTNVRV